MSTSSCSALNPALETVTCVGVLSGQWPDAFPPGVCKEVVPVRQPRPWAWVSSLPSLCPRLELLGDFVCYTVCFWSQLGRARRGGKDERNT